MDEQNQPPQRLQYKWPWFVLGAVVLGAALAILWMTVLVRRIHEERENAWPPPAQIVPPQTNSSPSNAP